MPVPDVPPRPKPAIEGQDFFPSARMWNALTALVYQRQRFGAGVSGQYGFSSARSTISKRREIDVQASESIVANSIFGITTGQAYDDQPIASVARVGVNFVGSSLTLFTNPIELVSGVPGKAHPIDLWTPTLVRYSGSPPGIGQPCGFQPDSLAVSSSYWGFECVSQPTSGRVWVVGSTANAVCGFVLSEIEAFDSTTRQLGAGTMRIEYRIDGSNQLQRAYNPTSQTKPWVVPVYNNCLSPILFGDTVVARNVVGVGLVVDPCASPSSSASSSSSPPPSSSSPSSSSPPPSSSSSPSSSSPSSSSPSLSSSSSESEESSSSGSPGCVTISGVDLANLQVVDPANVDGILAVQDGCLVIVPVAPCDDASSS